MNVAMALNDEISNDVPVVVGCVTAGSINSHFSLILCKT